MLKVPNFVLFFQIRVSAVRKKARRQDLMPIAGKQSGKAQHKKQGKKEEYEDEDDREFKRKQREAAEKTRAAAAQLQASKK